MPERLPDGRIRIPARAETGGITGDGMAEIGPGDPQYADYDAYLKTQEAGDSTGPPWVVTGEIPDTGEKVILRWDGGIADWPPDALDWAIAAADDGQVQLDDGPGLHAWLLSQEFRDALPAETARGWRDAPMPRERGPDTLRRLPPPERRPARHASWTRITRALAAR